MTEKRATQGMLRKALKRDADAKIATKKRNKNVANLINEKIKPIEDVWMDLNIHGQPVRIVLNKMEEDEWFCAYATLKDSRYLSESYLGGDLCEITYREGDEVGIDTNNWYYRDMDKSALLQSAIRQIQSVIENWMSVINTEE